MAAIDVTFDFSQANPVATHGGYTRANRAALANEGLVKFREHFVKRLTKTPLSSNLTASSYKPAEMTDKNNFFNAISSFSTFTLRFQAWLKTHYADNVFTIIKRDWSDANNQYLNTTTVLGDLFNNWNTLTLEEVFNSCTTIMRHSDLAVDIQNLNITWELLLANIDEDLRAHVLAEASSFITRNADCAQSGPMAFAIIAKRVIHASDALAHHVFSGLMTMGLVHFKGKNVVECVSILRTVLVFLGYGTNRSNCPPTINSILIDVFLRCSNTVFVSFMRNLRDVHAVRVNNPELIFAEAQAHYNELIIKPNGWARTTKTRTAFMAELPELAAILDESPEKKTTPADTAPSPAASGKQEVDRKGRPIDRTPPKDGVTRRKKEDGYNEYWCGKCNRWGNHDDDHHDKFLADQKAWREKRNAKRAEKKAKDSETTTTTTAPSMHGSASYAQPSFCPIKNALLSGYDSDQSF